MIFLLSPSPLGVKRRGKRRSRTGLGIFPIFWKKGKREERRREKGEIGKIRVSRLAP